jgi:hypothetical protein
MSEGRVRDRQDPFNRFDSIRFRCEFDSNEIDESELQRSKHDDPRISTFPGIEID